MIEGLFGRRDLGGLDGDIPEIDLGALDDVRFDGVEVYNSIFEVPMHVALERLPPSVRSSIPAVAYYTIWRCRSGALGPFSIAFMGLACRTGIKPRFLAHGAFTDSGTARTFFRRRYGFPVETAEIGLREGYDRIVGNVARDGRTILDITSTGISPLVGLGAFIKYSPVLNIARVAGEVGLLQAEASYEFKRVMRATPRLVVHDAAALGDPAVVPAYAVSSSYAIVDLTLHPVRFVIDRTHPAESGGARKIDRDGAAPLPAAGG